MQGCWEKSQVCTLSPTHCNGLDQKRGILQSGLKYVDFLVQRHLLRRWYGKKKVGPNNSNTEQANKTTGLFSKELAGVSFSQTSGKLHEAVFDQRVLWHFVISYLLTNVQTEDVPGDGATILKPGSLLQNQQHATTTPQNGFLPVNCKNQPAILSTFTCGHN